MECGVVCGRSEVGMVVKLWGGGSFWCVVVARW